MPSVEDILKRELALAERGRAQARERGIRSRTGASARAGDTFADGRTDAIAVLGEAIAGTYDAFAGTVSMTRIGNTARHLLVNYAEQI